MWPINFSEGHKFQARTSWIVFGVYVAASLVASLIS